MSSLLSQAALFEAEESLGDTKRRKMARTIKKRPSRNVEALMQLTSMSDDEDESGLVDFQPMNPELTRTPQTRGTSQPTQASTTYVPPKPADAKGAPAHASHSQLGHNSQPSSYQSAHSPPANLQVSLNSALGKGISAEQGQIQFSNMGATNSGSTAGRSLYPADISEQLNYIIHLLEEQQNSKTSTTTEELILYTFLGVFTIYIVDSFTKVGKSYTR